MENDVIEIKEETKEKLRDFDEQEAYFLLCEIFSYAQATKDYARFQTDLNEWKKRFPIELFSEAYQIKIKYMLSKEFLESVLKDFIAFDELSKKDPSKGLEKLRKILDKAEKHKDETQLDKDLDKLYQEYPLKFLKEKYPHVVAQLLSKSNRTKILQKFDPSLAFKDLNAIVEKPQNYKDESEFISTIEEWKKLYPTDDFNDKYKSQVEKTLNDNLDPKRLEELFPATAELDLSKGQVIPIEFQNSIKNISLVSKDALYEFFNIVDKNKDDIDGLFNWVYKYNKYINSFDLNTKNAIVSSLMNRYSHEMPPVGTNYRIPKMDSGLDEFISLQDYTSIKDTKKDSIIQLLGILSTDQEITEEDRYRLEIINSNVKKADIIKEAKIEDKVEVFAIKTPVEQLTPYDIKLSTSSDACSTSGGTGISSTSTEPKTIAKDIENVVDNAKEVEEEEIPLISIPATDDIHDISNNEPIIIEEEHPIKAVILESEPSTTEGKSSNIITEIEPKIEPETKIDFEIETEPEVEIQPKIETAPKFEVETQPDIEEISHETPVRNFFKHLFKADIQERDEGNNRDER